MNTRTFEFAGMWIAKQGEFVAFGHTEEQAKGAAENPNSTINDDLVVRFSDDEWRILSEFIIDLENRKSEPISPVLPIPLPSDPTAGTYAVLSPAGRKYGTWCIIRQSTRNSNTWDTVMPDVGSAENAQRLVGLLNSQNNAKSSPALKIAEGR